MSNVPPILFFNGSVPTPPPGFQNSHFQTDNGFPVESISDNVPGTGFVIVVTGDFTAGASNCGNLLVFNASGPATLSLPPTVPFLRWCLFVTNAGASPLSIQPNGPLLDFVGTPITLASGQGAYIATDGIGYYSERGSGTATGGTPDPTVIPKFQDEEIPAGVSDGTNPNFTLEFPPDPPKSLKLVRGGLVQLREIDFTLDGVSITFLLSNPDNVNRGEWLRAWYRYMGPPVDPNILYRIDFTDQVSVTFQHNLNSFSLMPGVWDETGKLISYGSFQLTDPNTAVLTFPAPQSGTLIVTPSAYLQAFLGALSVTVTHNLGAPKPIPVVYDSFNNVIIPDKFTITDSNNDDVEFIDPQDGNVQIMTPVGSYTQSFTGVTSVAITHNLGETLLKASVYDGGGNLITFESFGPTDINNSLLTFATAQTGSIVVSKPLL